MARPPMWKVRELLTRPWLSPMISLRFAAIMIQSQIRRFQVKFPPRPAESKKRGARTAMLDRYLAAMQAGRVNVRGGFSEWCAVRIQAWARAQLARKRYDLHRYSFYQIAALQIQGAWREFCQQRYVKLTRKGSAPSMSSPQEGAAVTIQDLWRRYTNVRIYRYYRDLIRFRLVGDPATLLRTINPSEAHTLDKAMGVHLRFRLGGASFPPMMYYKLFLHRPLCDIGAFAPRDYTTSRPGMPAIHNHDAKPLFHERKQEKRVQLDALRVGGSYFGAVLGDLGPDGTAGWYRRVENNPWRPITMHVLSEVDEPPSGLTYFLDKDFAPPRMAGRGKPFHYLYTVRSEERARLKKVKKRKWLQQLYRDGLAKERDAGGGSEEKKRDETKFDDDDDDDDKIDTLLSWSKELDFDAYLSNWSTLATSGPAGRTL